MRLFISYSRDDKAWVYELWRALRDRVFHDAWIDQRIVPAQDWWESILQNIEAAEAAIYIMTPKSVESIYCIAEIEYAARLNKPIVPIMLKSCDVPGLIRQRRIQFQTITDQTSMVDTLLTIQLALSQVQDALHMGKYRPPKPAPSRPEEPKPARKPEQVSEVFMLAEEAVGENNLSLAEKLFQQVIDADPHGWGLAAAERLGEIRFEDARQRDYLSIVQMAHNPAFLKGAQAAWRAFAQRHPDYDPQNLVARLGGKPASPTSPVAPAAMATPPVEWPAAIRQPSLAQSVQTQPAMSSGYEVILTQIGPNKDNVFNAIRSLTGCSLAEAKIIFETPRSRVLERVTESEANAAKARLTAEGAWAEVAPLPDTAQPVLPDQGIFAVVLADLGMRKIDVIRVVRALSGLGLAETKALVETPRATLLKDVPGYVARWAKIDLEAVGATVEIVPLPGGETSPAVVEALFDVILKDVGPKKINVIKVIRALTPLGLAEAKALTDTSWSTVLQGVPGEAAEAVRKQLEAEGASVELRQVSGHAESPSAGKDAGAGPEKAGIRAETTNPPLAVPSWLSFFDVILKNVGPNKINVIKAVRVQFMLGLAEAKTLVETPDACILRRVPEWVALEVKSQLEAEGAVLEVLLVADKTGPSTPVKGSYTVVLEEPGPMKIDVIKAVRALTPLGLAEAKTLVETPPKAILEGISLSAAETAKTKLQAVRAVITIVPVS